MNANIQIIAKEGWFGAIVLGVLFLVCVFFEWEVLGVIFLLAFVLWLFMFRNPERIAKNQPKAFLSPVDGIVRHIDILEENVCVQIYTRFFDVGVVRAPSDILHASLKKVGGLTLCFADSDKKRMLNASFSLAWKDKQDFRLEFFPEFFSNSRIYADSNLASGERLGFMKKGLTKIYLPKSAELKVSIGDKVSACNSVIGEL